MAPEINGVDANHPEKEKNAGKITRIECTTTAADEPFTLEVYHSWSPLGAERFVALVEDGFFTDVAFFRCVKDFLVQFGVAPDPESEKKRYWQQQGTIADDPTLGIPFKRGTLSFAGGGVDSRGTQAFITFKDLSWLGKALWETPFGVVTKGMDTVVDKLYNGYGDQKGFNENGIDQGKLQRRGNEYLREEFPDVSYFKECKVVGEIIDEENAIDVSKASEVQSDVDSGSGLWVPPHRLELPQLEQRAEQLAPKLPDEVMGGSHPQSSSFFIYFLASTLLGVLFLAWKKSKKNRRRTH